MISACKCVFAVIGGFVLFCFVSPFFLLSSFFQVNIINNPSTASAVGAPQMTLQPLFSICLPVLHCPLGLVELQACPFPNVVSPSLQGSGPVLWTYTGKKTLPPSTSLPVMDEIAGVNTASLSGYLHGTKTRARWAEGFHTLNGHVFDLERDGLRQVVLCPRLTMR